MMDLTAVVWVAISLVGFIFAAVDVADAYAHHNLVRVGWPNHERLAGFTRNQFLSQAARTILLLIFLIIGINALVGGPSRVFVYGMFIGNLVVVAAAIKSHRYRRQVFREERNEFREKEDSDRVASRMKEDVDRVESRAQEDVDRSERRSREDHVDRHMDALNERAKAMKATEEKEQDSE